jgi:hypothetical protein
MATRRRGRKGSKGSKGRKSRKSSKNIISSTTNKVTKGVSSGLNKVGKTVTGTAKGSFNRLFKMFGMKKSRSKSRS